MTSPGQLWLQLSQELAELTQPAPCQRPAIADRWYSSRAEDQVAAVLACETCPVQGPCRDYAIAAQEGFGVWGGTTPAERHPNATRRKENHP